MSANPTEQSHEELLALFNDTYQTLGFSEQAIENLLEFAGILYRENKHLRSQIETDTAYRNELEVEKLGLQIDIHNLKAENG